MSHKPAALASLKIDLHTGDWLLAVPADFDYAGPEADAIIALLPTITARRSHAA